MKFNSKLLIICCLLQALICSTDGVNEQSLIDAANKTLKYAKAYHEGYINLEDKTPFVNLKFNYSALTPENIQFRFDEFKLLHIKFVNIKGILSGKYQYKKYYLFTVNSEFNAHLYNVSWEQTFAVSQNVLEDGKIDIKFKSTEQSKVTFNIFRLTSEQKYNDAIKNGLLTLEYKSLRNQLNKISNLIFETLQSDLNRY